MVYSKLEALDQSKFLLGENMVRIDPSLKPALREALVNTLAHADYTIPRGSVKILAYDDRYVFQNPGCMLIKPEDFFVGGKSELRNEIIAVRGNCEAEVDQMVLPFPVLSESAVVFADDKTIKYQRKKDSSLYCKIRKGCDYKRTA